MLSCPFFLRSQSLTLNHLPLLFPWPGGSGKKDGEGRVPHRKYRRENPRGLLHRLGIGKKRRRVLESVGHIPQWGSRLIRVGSRRERCSTLICCGESPLFPVGGPIFFFLGGGALLQRPIYPAHPSCAAVAGSDICIPRLPSALPPRLRLGGGRQGGYYYYGTCADTQY